MRKQIIFILVLLLSASAESMIVPDLTWLCSKKIAAEVERGLPEEQLNLLANAIDVQFPPESINKYVAWLNVAPEKQLDLFGAITTLNQVAKTSIETDIFHITPVSLRIKKALPEGLIKKFYWEALEINLTEKMYHKSAVIKRCMDLYSSYLGSWDLVHLTAGRSGIDIPVNFQILAGRMCNKAREKREREYKSRRTADYDERCP